MKLFQDETDSPQTRQFRFKGSFSFHAARQGYSSANSTDCNIDSSKLSGHISEISQCLSELSNICWISFNEQSPMLASNSSVAIDFHDFNVNHAISAKPLKKRLYARGDSKLNSNQAYYSLKALKFNKGTFKKNSCTSGRWSEDEHRRFVEAIIKYGNDWKNVQSHIKTRSSAQSRSHSQKFFMKIKNYDLLDLKDLNPSIGSLNELAKTLGEKEREELIELLISCEYNDSQQETQSFLHRKRRGGESINEEALNYAIQFDEPIQTKKNLGLNPSAEEMTQPNLNLESSKPVIVVTESDDFHSNFFTAFQRGRRISFEENMHTFYFYLYQDAQESNDLIIDSKDTEAIILGQPHVEYAI